MIVPIVSLYCKGFAKKINNKQSITPYNIYTRISRFTLRKLLYIYIFKFIIYFIVSLFTRT